MKQLLRCERDAASPRFPLMVVTEGVSDIELLKRISCILHANDSTVVDLSALEAQGELVFIPSGGGDIAAWHARLRRLPNPRFQLHDRETGEETVRRLAAVAASNGPDSIVRLTSKRALENYLHPQAIVAAGGPRVEIDDHNDVPAAVAKAQFVAAESVDAWPRLAPRARKRLSGRAKRWLYTRAAEQMSAELFAARDPRGEVRSWLALIAELAT